MDVIVTAILLVTTGNPSIAQSNSNINKGPCQTPGSKRGLCIDITQCPSLRNILRLPKSELDEHLLFLRRSVCSESIHNSSTVYVCCPDGVHVDFAEENKIPASPARPCGIAEGTISSRIMFGNETNIREHPWMALIGFNESNVIKFRCGGSLINDWYVLTAAHCLQSPSDNFKPTIVRLGEYDTNTEFDCTKDINGNQNCAERYVDICIQKLIVHPKYDKDTKSSDIALIQLFRSAPYNDFIRPICLPLEDSIKNATFEGTLMDVVGWGVTETGQWNNVKLKASVQVAKLEDCKPIYRHANKTIDNSQMCAGGVNRVDSCDGDSGGPLVGISSNDRKDVYNFIAGVVSYGSNPCGFPGWPSVYTRVGAYIDWIEANTRYPIQSQAKSFKKSRII